MDQRPRVYARDSCRLCDGRSLTPVLSLTPTPPANAFVAPSEAGDPQETFPLEVVFCQRCAHVQLRHVVDPVLLFERYVYVSGTSPVFVEHFRRYADDIIRGYDIPSEALVVDIGSNDGTLMRFFKDAGRRVLGIDPAREIALAATQQGIETIPAFFSLELARELRQTHGRAAAITANNVFAHIDDLPAIVAGLRELLDERGVFVFEVSYLADVYEKTLFDTIYHEHLDYHTVKPLAPFFERQGLELIEAFRIDTHGGSLRGVAQLRDGGRPKGRTVAELIAAEEVRGLDHPEVLRAFGEKIDRLKAELGELLRGLKARGKRIAGYGAPAKATTLMYHFGLSADVIDFLVDDSPLKQGLLSPGFHIPILPSSAIYERRPDYLLLLAWNFATPIMEKHATYAEGGGRFIVPLPAVRVY